MVATQGNYKSEDRGTGWALLLGQMNRTLRLLAKVHEARGELRQADQLRAVDQDLEQLREDGGAQPRQDRPQGPRGAESARAAAKARMAEEEATEARRRRQTAPDIGLGR